MKLQILTFKTFQLIEIKQKKKPEFSMTLLLLMKYISLLYR